MTQIQANRLAVLIQDLQEDPGGFDFSIISCGTKACAIGRCGRLFPGLVKVAEDPDDIGWATLRKDIGTLEESDFDKVAEFLFGLHGDIFTPYFPLERGEAPDPLRSYSDAGARQVADMLIVHMEMAGYDYV